MAFSAVTINTLISDSTTKIDVNVLRKNIPIPVKLAITNKTTTTGGRNVVSNINPITNRDGTIGPAHAIVS